MNNIHSSWKSLFDQYSFNLDILYDNNITFPPKELVFKVFDIDVNNIQIVIIAQDPYHAKGQANGLCFSVPSNVKIPPSLNNIFKELKLEFPDRNYVFSSGNIDRWFHHENIFLLNSSLTVLEANPGSHMKVWQDFTDDVIKFISEQNNNCIFLLLGSGRLDNSL